MEGLEKWTGGWKDGFGIGKMAGDWKTWKNRLETERMDRGLKDWKNGLEAYE
ncbi:hypothetical protein Pcinc_005254, partial [Petrolisthes cinctipes]